MAIETNEISEIFSPALKEEYTIRFQCLVKKLGEVFPSYRDLLIKQEIAAAEDITPHNDFEGLKYIAALRVLNDLVQQGWNLEVGSDLILTMLTGNLNDKEYVRHRLSIERKAQFKVDSNRRFIDHMERTRVYHGHGISIKSLVGDKDALIHAIKNKERIIDPYIQLVTHSIDEQTGYRDIDIWRYFRYTWSIPYKSMPGRNLFYLVRDRAQEFHPVIGIFALGNAVLNLTVRDNEIGWTVDAIRSRLNDSMGSLKVLAGQTPDGSYQLVDLARAPHMLIAGTTGSGKTVFLYSIIVSLLHQLGPEDLELLIVDPKQTDFHFFEGIPHLRGHRVLTDSQEALDALELINNEDKEVRTQLIRSVNSRDIDSYNSKNPKKHMKRLVVVIDEYADLVQAAELQGRDVRRNFETNLCMLAQRVRNLGIHLVIATQQPRATIVTSPLKAVLPYRLSFRLPSHVDSQTILDRAGAEDLLGKGDMLLMTDSDIIRMQGFFISEEQLLAFIESKK